MPTGINGRGWRRQGKADKFGGENNWCSILRAMPGLNQWEKQADREERPPTREKDARLEKFENAREKCSGQDEQGHLDTPENHV